MHVCSDLYENGEQINQVYQVLIKTMQNQQEYKDIEEELGNSSYVRFHTQQESLEFELPQNENGKMRQVPLPFNRVISETIADLMIMNKQIYTNSRVSMNLIESGREISKTKNQYWEQFIYHEPDFQIASEAFKSLAPHKQVLLKYNVLSLSNLLLKLGINMSKISLILMHRPLTYNCLSLFGLSVAFLQYLEYSLFKSKKIKEQINGSLFLRQLPKITIIKLAHRQNSYQTELLQTSQDVFFTKNSRASIKNLQFIQLYENEDDIRKYERKTPYQHIKSYNIKQSLQIEAPFSFQLYYFMKTYIFPQVKEFRPDMILFVETYRDDALIMDPEVRGLLLSEMIETLTPKIYFLREMGVSLCLHDYLMKKFGNWHNNFSKEILEEVQKEETKIFLQMSRLEEASTVTKQYLTQTKKSFLDDLAFTALALIQKNSQYKLTEKAHKHIYGVQFLERVTFMQDKLIQEEGQKEASEVKGDLIKAVSRFRNTTAKTIDFLKQNYNYADKKFQNIVYLVNKTKYYDQIFNLKEDKIEKLEVEGNKFNFADSDQIYVKYSQDKLIVTILRQNEYCILVKQYGRPLFTLAKQGYWQNQNLKLIGCSLACSDTYIYRGFGKFINNYRKYNNVIYRHRIVPNAEGSYGDWEQFATSCIPLNSQGQKCPPVELQRKHSGYGYFNRISKQVVMMGGYVDCTNEEKISKRLYLIEKDQQPVYSMGKTNRLVFQTKQKAILYPFVFGLPFTYKDKVFVLNTNGDFDHLNNSRKLFLSHVQASNMQIYNGVKTQSRLKIPFEVQNSKEEYLNNKNRIVDYIVLAGDKINRYNGRCSLRTLDEGPWVLEIKEKVLYAKSFANDSSQSFQLHFE